MIGLYDRNYEGDFLITEKEQINISEHTKSLKQPLIPNSIISLENKELKIISPSNNLIFGVLCVSSKVSYGKTKTGGTKRKFVPYDSKYPDFIVGSNKPSSVYDLYVSIKFEKYEVDNPIGVIVDYFGEIGDIKAEEQFFTKYAQYNWTKIEKQIDINDYLSDDIKRQDLSELHIISIDPENCQDIDDAIHIRKVKDNINEIGIHIADVSSYIKAGSLLDKELKNRSESIYLPNKQINMIPDSLSINHMSLKKGTSKRAYSLLIMEEKGKIIDYKFVKTLVNIKENYSYEQADKMIKNKEEYLYKLYEIAVLIQKERTNSSIQIDLDNIDSHKMIEVYMVLTNHLAAKEISKNLNHNIIMRTHTGYKNNNHYLINKYNMQKAHYSLISNESELINSKHIGLGEDYYTHFTSPIRRYADILVHRLLNAEDSHINMKDIYIINQKQKDINKISRELDTVIKLNEIIKSDEITEIMAEIIGMNENRLLLKLNKYDIVTDYEIIPYKLKHLFNTEIIDDTIIIINKETKNKIELKLLQTIKILMSITMKKSKNKINCRILDPNTDILYK